MARRELGKRPTGLPFGRLRKEVATGITGSDHISEVLRKTCRSSFPIAVMDKGHPSAGSGWEHCDAEWLDIQGIVWKVDAFSAVHQVRDTTR